MSSYLISHSDGVLKIGFGTPAQNDVIVRDTDRQCCELVESGQVKGGELLRINGPASLPVAMVIAHRFGHLFGAIACFDPKLAAYVIVITHTPKYGLGDILR